MFKRALLVVVIGFSVVADLAVSQSRAARSFLETSASDPNTLKGAVLKANPDPNPRATSLRDQEARNRQLTAYQGTKMVPHRDADGKELVLQKDLAALFVEQDPPASTARLALFSWMDDPEIRCNGWYGGIQEVGESPNFLYNKVAISPILASEKAMAISSTYYVVETYELRQGVLSLLKVEEPPVSTLKALITD